MKLYMVAANLREWAALQSERQRLLALRSDPTARVPTPILERKLAEVDRDIRRLEVTA